MLRAYPGMPFILAFLFLLAIAVALLSQGDISSSDNIGVYAFLVLVAGTIIHLSSLSWNQRKRDGDRDRSGALNSPGLHLLKFFGI